MKEDEKLIKLEAYISEESYAYFFTKSHKKPENYLIFELLNQYFNVKKLRITSAIVCRNAPTLKIEDETNSSTVTESSWDEEKK